MAVKKSTALDNMDENVHMDTMVPEQEAPNLSQPVDNPLFSFHRPKPLNDHIPVPGMPLSEWLKHPHSAEEVALRLHTGHQYEETGDASDEITEDNIANATAAQSGAEKITPYEKQKLSDLRNQLNQMNE